MRLSLPIAGNASILTECGSLALALASLCAHHDEQHSKDDKGTVLLKSVPLRHAPGASLVGFACTTDGQYAISCADRTCASRSRVGHL